MKIKQVAELLSVGIYESFTPEKTQTIKELLAELGLSDKYLAVLVNGKKAGLDAIVHETDNIVILPHIAGGMNIFEQDGKIRLQLMELTPVKRMLFDFTIDKEAFEPLREHIIQHLNKFQLG